MSARVEPLDSLLASIAHVDGWLTDAQAERLWRIARGVEAPATIVEIGTYHGRSASVLAHACRPGVELVAIDPHASKNGGLRKLIGLPIWRESDYATLMDNLARAGVADAVRHVRLRSREALAHVDGPFDVLYIDGAHRLGAARADIGGWGARVRPGGTLLIHDAFSSIGVTLAMLTSLVFRADFAYAGRVGTLAEYRRVSLPPRRRARSVARQLRELPWFTRNVAIRVALVLRARPLARALGHRDATVPY